MQRSQRLGLIITLLLATPGLLFARDARLIGKVLDPSGKVVEGVTVVATSEELPDFRQVETTDRRGVFKIDFPQRHVTYVLRFEKGGFHPLESTQEWSLEGTARQEFTMTPGEATVDSGIPLISSSSLAIRNFNAGVEAFNAGDFQTAGERFREALESDAELHPAWVALSRVQFEQREYQQAAEAAERAISLGTSDEAAWRTRWEAYKALGDEERAVEALKDLENAAIRAEEARGIYNEGVRLAKSGDHAAAVAKFREALEVDPNLEVAQMGLAVSAVELGEHETAARAARAVLQGDPENEQAVRIRYNAALALGDSEQLMGALVALAPFEPQVARDGLLRLAFEVYDANDMPEARTRFLRVVEVDPGHALSHYFLGLINANIGDTTQAATHLRRFLALDPNHTEAGSARELLEYLGGS